MFWRVIPAPHTAIIPDAFAADLTMHLRYAPITATVMRIGDQQHTYIATTTCRGCHSGHCAPACRTKLLHHMLLAHQAVERVHPVSRGLASRAYTRLVYAIPRHAAEPLPASVLTAWPEARLWATWRMMFGRKVVGLALAVGQDGPDPLRALQERGWSAVRAPVNARTLHPGMVPYGWTWTHPVVLLLPPLLLPSGKDSPASVEPPLLLPTSRTATLPPQLSDSIDVPLMIAGDVCGAMTDDLVHQGVAWLDSLLHTHWPEHAVLVSPDDTLPDAAAPDAEPALEEPVVPVPVTITLESEERPGVWGRVPGSPLVTPVVAPLQDAPPQRERLDDSVLCNGSDEPSGLVPDSTASDTAEPNGADSVQTVTWPVCHALAMGGREVRAAIGALLTVLAQQDVTGQRHKGVTPKNVAQTCGMTKADAQTFLAWLDAAHILAAPPNPALPWDAPRLMRITEIDAIASALHHAPQQSVESD